MTDATTPIIRPSRPNQERADVWPTNPRLTDPCPRFRPRSIENFRGLRRHRPDHFLDQLAILLLPLRQHHLVAELQAVLLRIVLELGFAEEGRGVGFNELARALGLIPRPRLLDGVCR